VKAIKIVYERYIEEDTNDPEEIRDCKREGPNFRLPSSDTVRIPYTGFEAEGITFTLSGFGKLDKPRKAAISPEAAEWMRKFLGKAFNFSDELRGAMVAMVKDKGWENVKHEIQSTYGKGENCGRLQAVQKVLLDVQHKATKVYETEVVVTPPVVVEYEPIDKARLKEMGLDESEL
jgi:hypothetical protein